MSVGAEYKEEYERVKKVVAELKAARENDNTPEDQWAELNNAIEAYESKMIELEATGPSIVDQILQKYYPPEVAVEKQVVEDEPAPPEVIFDFTEESEQ